MANKRENFEIGDLTMQCQNKKPLIIKYCLKVKNSDCLVRNYVLSARSIVSVKPQTSSLWHEAVRRFFYKGMRLHVVPSKATGVRPVPRNFTLLRQNTVAEIRCGKTELAWLVRYKFSWWSKVWWTLKRGSEWMVQDFIVFHVTEDMRHFFGDGVWEREFICQTGRLCFGGMERVHRLASSLGRLWIFGMKRREIGIWIPLWDSLHQVRKWQVRRRYGFCNSR